jgi:hypothetical protein
MIAGNVIPKKEAVRKVFSRVATTTFALAALCVSGLLAAVPVWAQRAADLAGGQATGSITLTPSVIMLKGRAGQSSKQTLRMTNNSSMDLGYEMVAQDVVVRDGRRTFLPAGQLAESIAATAIFSKREVVVPAGKSAEVDVTLTVPPKTGIRAVAIIFHTRQLTGRRENVGIATSLGTLVTFTLSDVVAVEASEPVVTPQSPNQNLSVALWLTNSGQEPVIPNGVVAWLDAAGKLVARSAVEPRRLLPGERLEFRSELPTDLPAGRYRALVALQYGEKSLTASKDVTIP